MWNTDKMQSIHALILTTFLVQAVCAINPDYQRGEDEDVGRPGNVGRHGGETLNGHASNNMSAQEDTIPTPGPTTDAAQFAAAARETEQQKSVNGVNQGGTSNEGRNNRRRQHKGQRKDGNHHRAQSREITDNANSTEEESQNSKISQKRTNQVHVGGKNGKTSRKGDRRGKKGGMERGHSEGPHPPHQGFQGGDDVQAAFNHLSRGAGQMMNQWMKEAKRRYPEEFTQLIKEWRGIMEDFENISVEADENSQVTFSESSEEEGCSDSKDYNYDFGTGPSLDCAEKPSYTVECSSPAGYEVRRYDSATWVSTSVNTSSYDFAGMVGFKKLFEYIQGKNDQGIRLAMTLPVHKRIWSNNGEIAPISLLREENFVVSFYVPSKNTENPPLPVDDELFIHELSYYVYAFNFSGWAYGLNVYEKYFQYENILRENGEPFVRGDFRMQMYDSPWIPVDRHNELLIPVDVEEGHPTCGTQTAFSRGCMYDSCPSQIVVKTISTRQDISVRLLQAGVFAVQNRPVCDNLTDIIEQQDFVPTPNNQGCTIDSYLSLNLPVFLNARRLRMGGSGECHFNLEKQYFVPEHFQESFPHSDMIFEGTLHADRANPTLYFVMILQESGNQKLTSDNVYEQYERMTRILSDRGYCYRQNTFMLAYYKGQHAADSFELYVPVDIQCSNSENI